MVGVQARSTSLRIWGRGAAATTAPAPSGTTSGLLRLPISSVPSCVGAQPASRSAAVTSSALTPLPCVCVCVYLLLLLLRLSTVDCCWHAQEAWLGAGWWHRPPPSPPGTAEATPSTCGSWRRRWRRWRRWCAAWLRCLRCRVVRYVAAIAIA
eukprot:COSAG06_NODE_7756_length_2387_cov_4.354458_2_plen_153_part_00